MWCTTFSYYKLIDWVGGLDSKIFGSRLFWYFREVWLMRNFLTPRKSNGPEFNPPKVSVLHIKKCQERAKINSSCRYLYSFIMPSVTNFRQTAVIVSNWGARLLDGYRVKEKGASEVSWAFGGTSTSLASETEPSLRCSSSKMLTNMTYLCICWRDCFQSTRASFWLDKKIWKLFDCFHEDLPKLALVPPTVRGFWGEDSLLHGWTSMANYPVMSVAFVANCL